MRCARRSVTAARGSSPAGPGSTSITSSPPRLPVTSRMRSICWRRRAAGCCPTTVSTRAPACGAMLAAPRGRRCGCLRCPTARTGRWPTRAAARRQVKTPSRAICGRPARCWPHVRPPSATGRQGWAPTSRPCAGSRFPRPASGHSQRITRLMRQLTWRRGHVRRGNSGSRGERTPLPSRRSCPSPRSPRVLPSALAGSWCGMARNVMTGRLGEAVSGPCGPCGACAG